MAISIIWVRGISISNPEIDPQTATLWQITFSLPFFWFMTIFEPNEIGGRVKTVDLAGKTYECGGTIIHPKNKFLIRKVFLNNE